MTAEAVASSASPLAMASNSKTKSWGKQKIAIGAQQQPPHLALTKTGGSIWPSDELFQHRVIKNSLESQLNA